MSTIFQARAPNLHLVFDGIDLDLAFIICESMLKFLHFSIDTSEFFDNNNSINIFEFVIQYKTNRRLRCILLLFNHMVGTIANTTVLQLFAETFE